jgi:hypothetical protein
MSLRERTRPGLGTIEPCLPSPAKIPPSGPGWIHEIKQHGIRILARRDAAGVRLITRAGKRFLLLRHKVKKRRPPKRPPHWLKSVVALPPSIDVPRTIPIGLTNAALHRPTRSAAVPCAPSAVVIVIVMARADVDLECRGRDYAGDTNCADNAYRHSNLSKSSHDCSSFFRGNNAELGAPVS